MARDSAPAVGIDLGTTYSALAYLHEMGRPLTVPNAEGDLLTPSVVLFERGEFVVGKEAVKAMDYEAENVAQCAKRQLGERFFGQMLNGRNYPPEAVLGIVLDRLRRDAELQIGPFTKVVITVPAYFDEVRRKAVQDSGFMAGFEVLDIINEPTAAAIAHGYWHGFVSSDGDWEKRRMLVYDLGGGTFDVTLMEVKGTEFTTLATDGDVRLGGHEWDQRLVDFVAGRFMDAHRIDPREDANTAGRLWRECEAAKRTLSLRGKATISCVWRDKPLWVEVTREQFEDLTKDLLDRTEFTTRQTLLAAGLTWGDIDNILLVGGSTRMPMVVQMLTRLTGKKPEAKLAVDEAVVHGAALRAGILLTEQAGGKPAFTIKNVNSHSLGVVATDVRSGRKRNAILIPRNTQLPASAKRVFRTETADQRSILMRIIEGETVSPEDCVQIGRCVVRNLPDDLPAQTPVEVRFRYKENGRLTVKVTVEQAGLNLTHELTRENSLSPSQLEAWRAFIAGHKTGAEAPEDSVA